MDGQNLNTYIRCPRCGSFCVSGVNFCAFCGAPIRKPESKAKRVFLTLLQCLGYIAFFFAVQVTVELVAMIIIAVQAGISTGGAFLSEEYLYSAYGRWSWLLGTVSAVICVVCYALFFKVRKKSFARQIELRPLHPASFGGLVVCGTGGQFAAVILITVLYSLFPVLAENSVGEQLESMMQSPYPVLDFMHIAVLTPIVEEVLFRGIVYNKMKKVMPVSAAIVISGLVFGAAHMNLEQFMYAAPLGILMAAALEKYGSILAPIAVHFAFNGANYLIGLIEFSNDYWYTVMTVAGTGLLLLGIAIIFFTEKANGRTPAGKRKLALDETL